MAIEYKTTMTDLSPQDLDPFSPDDSVPDPVSPGGSGWRLVHTATSSTKIYYVWQRGAPVVTVSSNYNVDQNDEVILVNAMLQNSTVTLPFMISGSVVIVKKIDSSPNTVTIVGQPGQTIDGQTQKTISIQYNSFTLTTNGSNWFIV